MYKCDIDNAFKFSKELSFTLVQILQKLFITSTYTLWTSEFSGHRMIIRLTDTVNIIFLLQNGMKTVIRSLFCLGARIVKSV
jgi:hypothetical protein